MTEQAPTEQALTEQALTERDVPALFGMNPNESAWALFMRMTSQGAVPGAGPETDRKAGESPPALRTAQEIQSAMRPGLIATHLQVKSLGVEARLAKKAVEIKSHGVVFRAEPDFVIPPGQDTPRFGPGAGFAYLAALRPPEWHRYWRTGASPKAPIEWELMMQSVMWCTGKASLQWGLILPQIGLDPAQAPILVRRDEEICQKAGKAILSMMKIIADKGPEPAPNWSADREVCMELARKQAPAERPPMEPGQTHVFEEACRELSKARERRTAIFSDLDQINEVIHMNEARIISDIRKHGSGGRLEGGEFTAAVIEERIGEGSYKKQPGKPAPVRRSIAIHRIRESG